MGVFFFYNNRKPRKFNHVPILYNPEEEARKKRMQTRIQEIKKEMNMAEESDESPRQTVNFQEAFLSETRHLKKRKDREARGETPFFTNNIVLFVLILALIALFYFFFLR